MKHEHHKEQRHNKLRDISIVTLFSISIFLILILGSLNMMIFNKELYTKEYNKNGVYTNLAEKGVSEDEANNMTSNVLKFFRNKEELKYFTPIEQSHMQDVKNLIRTMQFIYYGASIVAVALFIYCYIRFKEDKFAFIKILAKTMLISSIAAGIFLILTFLLSVYSFDFLFTMFHAIFFPQGNWMFDSSSLLITLFPEQFFFDISLRIFIYAMFQSIIFFGIGYWMHKQLKIIEKHHPR